MESILIQGGLKKARPVFFVIAGCLLLISLSNCVTLERGEAMEAGIKENKALVQEHWKLIKTHQDLLQNLEKRLAELEKSFAEYQSISREKAASANVTLEQFKNEINKLQGMIEEQKYQLDVTKKIYEERIRHLESRDASEIKTTGELGDKKSGDGKADNKSGTINVTGKEPLPNAKDGQKDDALKDKEKEKDKDSKDAKTLEADKKELFKDAKTKIGKKEYYKGRELFKKFVKSYPDDSMADDALFALGKSYYDEKKYNDAIIEFQAALDRYPKGDMTEDSTFMLGECFYSLGLKSDSKVFFMQIKEKGKKADLKKKAESRLKSIP